MTLPLDTARRLDAAAPPAATNVAMTTMTPDPGDMTIPHELASTMTMRSKMATRGLGFPMMTWTATIPALTATAVDAETGAATALVTVTMNAIAVMTDRLARVVAHHIEAVMVTGQRETAVRGTALEIASRVARCTMSVTARQWQVLRRDEAP